MEGDEIEEEEEEEEEEEGMTAEELVQKYMERVSISLSHFTPSLLPSRDSLSLHHNHCSLSP